MLWLPFELPQANGAAGANGPRARCLVASESGHARAYVWR